jgi:hypothetical protein
MFTPHARSRLQANAKCAEAGHVFKAAGLADPFLNLATAVLNKTLPVPSLEANHLSSTARNLAMASTCSWRWSPLEHKFWWAVLLRIGAPKYMLLRGTMGQDASGSKKDKTLVANISSQMNLLIPSPQALNEWAKKTRPQVMASTGISRGAIQRFADLAGKGSTEPGDVVLAVAAGTSRRRWALGPRRGRGGSSHSSRMPPDDVQGGSSHAEARMTCRLEADGCMLCMQGWQMQMDACMTWM